MPLMEVLTPDQVPAPDRAKLPPEVAKERQAFEDYIAKVKGTGKVGHLVPEEDERVGSIRMKLSHASRRLQVPLITWGVNGSVYFKVGTDRNN